MKRMWSVAAVVLSGFLLLNVASTEVCAADFSADLTNTEGERIMKGKIHVMGNRYCMELEQGGEQLRVIVDPTQKITTVLQLPIKEFRVISIDDMMSVMNNPFYAYTYTVQHAEEIAAGSEMVGGYDCEKFQIEMDGSPIMSKWVSKKLDFPLKIVAHSDPTKTVELSNISEGVPAAELFEIPKGFAAWVDPKSLPVDPPEWAGEIATAPVMVPPFEKIMAAGEMVRVKIEAGKSLAVKGVGQSEVEATAKVIPFKGINPTEVESYFNNFAQQGVICDRRHEMSGEADEFIIRVYEGNVNVIAKWQPMFETTASAGEEVRYAISGKEHITTRIINLSDSKAEASFDYYAEGKVLSDDEVGPAKYRKIELENSWTVDRITRQEKGDEMVIRVEQGKMQIKLGQFDSFEF